MTSVKWRGGGFSRKGHRPKPGSALHLLGSCPSCSWRFLFCSMEACKLLTPPIQHAVGLPRTEARLGVKTVRLLLGLVDVSKCSGL